nr:relaxase/mobilization nuclease domain-containing protein [uncultured Oscillibacter sp.]
MAYDKIITIHNRLDHCVDYVLNEEKTGLSAALGYIAEESKAGTLVTGVNCAPERAWREMRETKRRWDKRGGVQGYHIVHSYAPGEVTPQEAHAAGVEFARRLLGDRFEAVVATHTDRDHLHCHIVFNSVSFMDGRRYRSDFKAYFGDIRGISNEVSRERDLSVIEPEGRGRHYAQWSAEQKSEPTMYGIVRADIDAAIAQSYTYKAFLSKLRQQGYEVRDGRKYISAKPPGGDRFIRLYRLGQAYSEEGIKVRLAGSREVPSAPPPCQPAIPRTPKRYTVRSGAIPRPSRQKAHGFRALYLYYLYLLNGPRAKQRQRPLPFSTRKEVTKLRQYQRQVRFLREYRIDTGDQLSMLAGALQAEMDALVERRKELYQRQRQGYEVSVEIGAINQDLRQLRRKWKLCGQIEATIPAVQYQVAEARRAQREQSKQSEHHERRNDRWM